MATGKRIPIQVAKDIANTYGYSEVIIVSRDAITGIQAVVTYGKTLVDCDSAARGGYTIKKLLGWDESLCNAVPSRIKKKKDENKSRK